MAEEFSWDPDVARHEVYPAMRDAADQVHAYAQPDTATIDFSQYGLGKIGHSVHLQVRQFYNDFQQWGAGAGAEMNDHATGVLTTTDIVVGRDGDSAAAVRGAAEDV